MLERQIFLRLRDFVLVDELSAWRPGDDALLLETRAVVNSNLVGLDHVEDHNGLGLVFRVLDEGRLRRRDALTATEPLVVVALAVNSQIVTGSYKKMFR